MGADLQTELLRTLDGQPDGAIKDTDTCMAGIDPMALRGVLSSLERREVHSSLKPSSSNSARSSALPRSTASPGS